MQVVKKSDKSIIVSGKVITELDNFVADIAEIISRYTEYVIVSGYVAILFGRARGTEDVDFLIQYMSYDEFSSLFHELSEEYYYFLNSDNINELYSMLCSGLAVRVAAVNMVIPNIEIKFQKDDYDDYAVSEKVTASFGDISFYISPVELQIPYKFYLGSEKDIEDAQYLWRIFKDIIDLPLLDSFLSSFDIDGEIYGIEI